MERWKEKKAIFMYKVRNRSFVENMTSIFYVADNKNYSLRSNNTDYSLDKPKTNVLKKRRSYSAGRLWNGMPNSLKENGTSLAKFKVLLIIIIIIIIIII